uniref:Uncharacterized protein n=1 Tax=Chromera velia CCMP2878 TaxID=1169474 RepID=A0A0G4GB22_9ALVE|eukprot:Cvel_21095.t1-p1 / transcript=Cvel_21095.t1 / gene=Cvel_21095 / organism=Chromera_velia_CCMP2878 / gene_product=hypothetical protein / transcript_product=hypothetical protein / location=Cvel_scaffold1950:23858-31388(+) / protein_length=1291 / sequence_SO=supercontig / SO=protein_coding / is_pseudo=false
MPTITCPVCRQHTSLLVCSDCVETRISEKKATGAIQEVEEARQAILAKCEKLCKCKEEGVAREDCGKVPKRRELEEKVARLRLRLDTLRKAKEEQEERTAQLQQTAQRKDQETKQLRARVKTLQSSTQLLGARFPLRFSEFLRDPMAGEALLYRMQLHPYRELRACLEALDSVQKEKCREVCDMFPLRSVPAPSFGSPSRPPQVVGAGGGVGAQSQSASRLLERSGGSGVLGGGGGDSMSLTGTAGGASEASLLLKREGEGSRERGKEGEGGTMQTTTTLRDMQADREREKEAALLQAVTSHRDRHQRPTLFYAGACSLRLPVSRPMSDEERLQKLGAARNLVQQLQTLSRILEVSLPSPVLYSRVQSFSGVQDRAYSGFVSASEEGRLLPAPLTPSAPPESPADEVQLQQAQAQRKGKAGKEPTLHLAPMPIDLGEGTREGDVEASQWPSTSMVTSSRVAGSGGGNTGVSSFAGGGGGNLRVDNRTGEFVRGAGAELEGAGGGLASSVASERSIGGLGRKAGAVWSRGGGGGSPVPSTESPVPVFVSGGREESSGEREKKEGGEEQKGDEEAGKGVDREGWCVEGGGGDAEGNGRSYAEAYPRVLCRRTGVVLTLHLPHRWTAVTTSIDRFGASVGALGSSAARRVQGLPENLVAAASSFRTNLVAAFGERLGGNTGIQGVSLSPGAPEDERGLEESTGEGRFTSSSMGRTGELGELGDEEEGGVYGGSEALEYLPRFVEVVDGEGMYPDRGVGMFEEDIRREEWDVRGDGCVPFLMPLKAERVGEAETVSDSESQSDSDSMGEAEGPPELMQQERMSPRSGSSDGAASAVAVSIPDTEDARLLRERLERENEEGAGVHAGTQPVVSSVVRQVRGRLGDALSTLSTAVAAAAAPLPGKGRWRRGKNGPGGRGVRAAAGTQQQQQGNAESEGSEMIWQKGVERIDSCLETLCRCRGVRESLIARAWEEREGPTFRLLLLLINTFRENAEEDEWDIATEGSALEEVDPDPEGTDDGRATVTDTQRSGRGGGGLMGTDARSSPSLHPASGGPAASPTSNSSSSHFRSSSPAPSGSSGTASAAAGLAASLTASLSQALSFGPSAAGGRLSDSAESRRRAGSEDISFSGGSAGGRRDAGGSQRGTGAMASVLGRGLVSLASSFSFRSSSVSGSTSVDRSREMQGSRRLTGRGGSESGPTVRVTVCQQEGGGEGHRGDPSETPGDSQLDEEPDASQQMRRQRQTERSGEGAHGSGGGLPGAGRTGDRPDGLYVVAEEMSGDEDGDDAWEHLSFQTE